ncbi:MAG: hypothetical protein ACD_16C00117G0014 [uncultured bacterium]|nr:MAG: hypothetical protein ACD_16C00117G0014 [uncultured bacterium]OFW68321.1 MAG: hypothetical protein A2X70_03930 [Alphaproteobacteria bacterium GWC2_42_16]OFW74795.1 MAG: hypothetical protein A2Z80_01795 [Alphaproteobacteria bacterium GWA2_41_27]OFW85160.1 MAG: hypothetical protein A3E50_06170 [Alphaproteobacteria bacterium RIFCSPHIGHO2_12_FULL_42_100]OFW85753.1 MAG: hypothetical protein A2W06_04315 [Alphaproteobacteria bacterium RBG_16_42_14]OFW91545.1 MAG: hypothetical protein A2W46_057
MKYSFIATALLLGSFTMSSELAVAQGAELITTPKVEGSGDAVIYQVPNPETVVQDPSVELQDPGHVMLPGGGAVDSATSLSEPGQVILPGGGEVDTTQIIDSGPGGMPEGLPPQNPPTDVPGRH